MVLCFVEKYCIYASFVCQLGHFISDILHLCSCVKSSELYLCDTLQKLRSLYILRRGMREQNSKME